MEESDYLDIDGRQLRLLLTIHDAGSLSKAAKMLDMNQSTVSYWLDQLRQRLDDPLFVRSGNGVKPTERASYLIPKIETALLNLQAIFEVQNYDAATDTGTLRLAGNAVDRNFVQSGLLTFARAMAAKINFEFVSVGSEFQVTESLRTGQLDFAVMPDGIDESEGIMRRRVRDFSNVVYFDSDYPLASNDLDAYCERPHVQIVLGPDRRFKIDELLEELGRKRRVALRVSDFDSALSLIRKTEIIATLPDCLSHGAGEGLAHIPVPWNDPPKTLMLYWHARNQSSVRHAFWRELIAKIGTETKASD